MHEPAMSQISWPQSRFSTSVMTQKRMMWDRFPRLCAPWTWMVPNLDGKCLKKHRATAASSMACELTSGYYISYIVCIDIKWNWILSPLFADLVGRKQTIRSWKIIFWFTTLKWPSYQMMLIHNPNKSHPFTSQFVGPQMKLVRRIPVPWHHWGFAHFELVDIIAVCMHSTAYQRSRATFMVTKSFCPRCPCTCWQAADSRAPLKTIGPDKSAHTLLNSFHGTAVRQKSDKIPPFALAFRMNHTQAHRVIYHLTLLYPCVGCSVYFGWDSAGSICMLQTCTRKIMWMPTSPHLLSALKLTSKVPDFPLYMLYAHWIYPACGTYTLKHWNELYMQILFGQYHTNKPLSYHDLKSVWGMQRLRSWMPWTVDRLQISDSFFRREFDTIQKLLQAVDLWKGVLLPSFFLIALL